MASLFDKQPEVDGEDMLVAYIDGGARGNPGPSGFGCYLQDGNGKMIAELNGFLGVRTNNFAEYSGLLAALHYAVENEFCNVEVVSDSELLVKQMKGQYKVNSPDLRPLYEEARALTNKLESFRIRHVLRHQNKEADRLANFAMDSGVKKSAPPRANAYEKPPANAREFDGIVRDGVVEIYGTDLPDGTKVKVRVVA